MVDRKTPPASPMVMTGHESLQAALRDVHGRGLTMRLENEIRAADRAAFACRCRYPDGREVLSNILLSTREGRITRVSEAQAWANEPLTSLCWRGVSETPQQREPEQGPEDEPTTADDLAAGPPTEAMEPPVADEPASEPLPPEAEPRGPEAEPLPPEAEPRGPDPVSERLTREPQTWSSALARGPADPPPKVRAEFPIVFRGYDREVVDAHLAAVEEDVLELHSTRSPQAAVRRELDRVGKETAAILQRAHEAADEIGARSRARADARVEEAEREAERIRRDAEQRARQLDKDVDEIWAERRKLVEDARALGEALIRLADEALDRFPPDEDGGPPVEAAKPVPSPPPKRAPAPEPEGEPAAPPRLLEEVPPPDNGEPPVGDPAIESVRRIPRPDAPRHPRRPQAR